MQAPFCYFSSSRKAIDVEFRSVFPSTAPTKLPIWKELHLYPPIWLKYQIGHIVYNNKVWTFCNWSSHQISAMRTTRTKTELEKYLLFSSSVKLSFACHLAQVYGFARFREMETRRHLDNELSLCWCRGLSLSELKCFPFASCHL